MQRRFNPQIHQNENERNEYINSQDSTQMKSLPVGKRYLQMKNVLKPQHHHIIKYVFNTVLKMQMFLQQIKIMVS